METVLRPGNLLVNPQHSDRTYSSVRRVDRASVDGPDFSLELSGGLESESNEDDNTLENIVSLDPEVLASLVIQLRTNLSSAVRERNDVRGERDTLMRDLAIVQTRLHELEGTQEREVEYLNEMSMWRKRCEEAEEQIGMLRGKVEESRRAVMTLQTQSRRLSQLSVPYGSPHAQTFGQDSLPRTPGYQKRMSLQAVTGAGPQPPIMGVPPKGRPHQRRSSVSDPEFGTSSIGSLSSHAPSSFPDTSPQEADSTGLAKQGSASRRHSAMISRPTESLLNPMGAELESLRQELIAVRMELMETKQELWESNEAKEASDVCLKALKEFIAENSIGDSNKAPTTTTLSLPPLPTDYIADTEEDGDWSRTPVASHAPSGSFSKKGWSLGFWGSPTAAPGPPAPAKAPSNDTAVSHSSTSPAPPTKSPTILVPATAISSFVSKWRNAPTTSPTTPSQAVPKTSSPRTFSPSHSLASAFSWNSGTLSPSQSSINDNYTPAPALGSIRRRPSAYSSPSFDSDHYSSGRKGSLATLFDKDGSEPNTPGGEKRDTVIAPRMSTETMTEISLSPEDIHQPLPDSKPSPNDFQRLYLDSTPSLTDTETTATNPSSGSEQEAESPFSTPGRLTQLKKGASSGGARGTRSTSRVTGDKDAPSVPPLPPPASPQGPECMRGKLPKSPLGSPKIIPAGLDGRRRARSRAASTAVNAGAAMETIDESAVERKTG